MCLRRRLAGFERWSSVLQLTACLALGVGFSEDVPFAMLLQSLAFVTLNRVATAQYFVWYMGLLPVALPSLARWGPRQIAASAAWVATQLHWLFWAYRLEFLGEPQYKILVRPRLCMISSPTRPTSPSPSLRDDPRRADPTS